MASSSYRRVVSELEALLSPRVVSKTLHEGLAPLGKTPETVSVDELAAVLRDRVYPRLQRSLGDAGAEAATKRIVALLRSVASAAQSAPEKPLSLRAQARAIEVLQRGLATFHLLFEWGESQRLRALLQLVAAEHAAGRDASTLIEEAQGLQGLLERKLEEQLVTQAGELTALEATLAELQGISPPSPRLRRLGTLLALIRRAHEERTRAGAEIERAHALAAELQAEAETARVERARKLATETRELGVLRRRFAALLALEPETERQLAAFEAQLRVREPLGEALEALPAQLGEAQRILQRALCEEFGALRARLEAEPPPTPSDKAAGEGTEGVTGAHGRPDDALLRELNLTLRVLDTTLPSPADVQRVRDVARARALGAEGELTRLHRLEAEAAPYRDLPDGASGALRHFLETARAGFEHDAALPDLGPGWRLLEQAEAESTAKINAFETRLRAVEVVAERLGAPHTEDALTLRWALRRLRAQQEAAGRLTPHLCADLSGALEEAEALASGVRGAAQTAREVAAQLVSTHALDEALRSFGEHLQPLLEHPPDEAAHPTATDPARSSARRLPGLDPHTLADLKGWLEARCASPSVAGAALFSDAPETQGAFHLAVGDLRADPRALLRAARLSRRRADALGEDLGQGRASFLTLEIPDCTLLITLLTPHYTLILVTPAPSWSSAARQLLETTLPELRSKLEHPTYSGLHKD